MTKGTYALPISMLAGAAAYFIYAAIPALTPTHALVGQAVSVVQPLLIFAMLFVTFCKVSPHALRPCPWMLLLLGAQLAGFALAALPVLLIPGQSTRIWAESAMICMICPTATAASVVTTRLGGDPGAVVSYTLLINLAASLAIPLAVPMLHTATGTAVGAGTMFLQIAGKVFPLLFMPMAAAWIVRRAAPKFHQTIAQREGLAFQLWTVALALAIGVTVKAVSHSRLDLTTLGGIAIVSLLCCLIQFAIGHFVGKVHGSSIAGAQSLGQKNTVFAIWAGYTFFTPATAIAGGFYSVWHNVVNSWQLSRK